MATESGTGQPEGANPHSRPSLIERISSTISETSPLVRLAVLLTTTISFVTTVIALVATINTPQPPTVIQPPSQPSPKPVATPSLPAGPSEAELRKTMTSVIVDEDLAESCFKVDDSRVNKELLSVECASSSVDTFRLAIFDSNEAMYDNYNKALKESKIRRNSGALNCDSNKPGEGEFEEFLGRFLCYVDTKGQTWIHWTHHRHYIYGYANRSGRHLKALDDWFDNSISIA